jgi:hypothetical protein
MEQSPRISNAAIFPIAFAGAVAAALIVPLWMLSSGASVAIAATMLFFGFPALLVALLLPVALMNLIAPIAPSKWFRWFLLPIIGAAVGYVLPQVVGLMFAVPGKMGAVAGLIGGGASAWVWGYLERHPEQAIASSQGVEGDA